MTRFRPQFSPRWQPRSLLFQGPASLLRVALAALWAEGQLPHPTLPRRTRRRALPQPATA